MKHKIKNYAEIDARIRERFDVLKMFTESACGGDCRSLIVSSPPGLGKSFMVEAIMKEWDPSGTDYQISRGYVLTTGLIRLLYAFRMRGQVLVFDDADTIFNDENSLNLLKAICDTTERRIVTYRAERSMVCEVSGDVIPPSFEFEANVIFLTNLNFDEIMDSKRNCLGPHLAALVSRSHYIDLAMESQDDFIVRIEQVRKEGLLDMLSKTHQEEVMDYIYDNKDRLRELSLRMAIKLAGCRQMDGLKQGWKAIAKITCCRVQKTS